MAHRVQADGPGRPPGAAVPGRRLSARERRRQLLAVALGLFAQRGYRATTMDEVAEAAGVTKPLLYQHFSSKRALYLELVDSVADDLLAAVGRATADADGPRQQVELGFAAYFRMVVTHESAFRLLYGRSDAGDHELGHALRRVEAAIVEAIDPLIAAGLDPEHRRLLAYAVVGMAEGASRQWLATRAGRGNRRSPATGDGSPGAELAEAAEVDRLARRMADLAWAGLRSVHAD
ncbi:MAG: TetR/AcrR family transcriptional regulator [Acidimicrobiales bacterium]